MTKQHAGCGGSGNADATECEGRASSPLWGKFGYSSWKISLLRNVLENE